MDEIEVHHVVLHKSKQQPSPDHVAFAAGNIDRDYEVEVPSECYYMPLASWMGMGRPETITVSTRAGRHLPNQHL